MAEDAIKPTKGDLKILQAVIFETIKDKGQAVAVARGADGTWRETGRLERENSEDETTS